MDVNISGPFMKNNAIDQLHSKDAVSISGTTIKLRRSSDRPAPCATSAVYLLAAVTVPPMSSATVDLRAPRIEAQDMAAADGFLLGSDKFEALYDCHPFRHVAVTPDDRGHLQGGIFNSLPDPVTIPAGTR